MVKIFLIKLEKAKIKRIIKIILIAVIEEEINQKIIAKDKIELIKILFKFCSL